MSARLLILVTLGVGLAVYYATVGRFREVPGIPVENDDPGLAPKDLLMLWKYDLPGEEPPEPPEFSINVWVDPTDGKSRLYFDITEAHGYYVETFDVHFYYKSNENTTIEDSPIEIQHYMNRYLKANDTLRDCIEVVEGELIAVNLDFGTTENWGAEVHSTGSTRARVMNPETLNPMAEATCFD